MKVAVRGCDLHCRELGKGSPVVLVHGLGLSSAWWDEQLAELARDWRAIALDLRGFGDSRKPPSSNVTVDVLVEDLNAFREALGIRRMSAIGHSLGGMILLRLALAHPEALSAMALVGASARFASEPGRRMLEARIEILERAGVAEMIDKTLVYTAASHFAPGFVEGRPEILERVRGEFSKIDADAYISLSREIMRFDLVSQLPGIGCPTLVVVGEHDDRCPVSDAILLNTHIKRSWLKVMPGAGHSPMVEQPKAFRDVVTDFFSAFGGE